MSGSAQGRPIPIRLNRFETQVTAAKDLLCRSWDKTPTDHSPKKRWAAALSEAERTLSKQSDTGDITAEAFAHAFDLWLLHTTAEDDRRKSRRRSGAYFTPPCLVEPILEHAAQATLMDRIRKAIGRQDDKPLAGIEKWSRSDRDKAEETLLDFYVCDPACGPATFLLPAGDLLATRLTLIRHRTLDVDVGTEQTIRVEVVRRLLHGVDIDPLIAQAARIVLWLWAGRPIKGVDELTPNIVNANSLDVSRGKKGFDWRRTFPHVFHRSEDGFDVMVGNPPFANAIELEGEDALRAVKDDSSRIFTDLSGTADLAYYFLALADHLTSVDGAIGFVLPRAVLNTGAVKKLRERLLQSRPPAMIHASTDPFLFRDANIFVTSLVLRGGRKSITQRSHCLVSQDQSKRGESPRFRSVTIESDNWWSPLLGERNDLIRTSHHSVEEQFELWGSMTTGMAYDLQPFIKEMSEIPRRTKKDPSLLKLVTTGLIDPGCCRWGEKECRYLKQRFGRPVIDERDDLLPSLRNRLIRVRRPKILVAGLSTRVEAFFDREGSYAGAVSTYTIIHPRDDLAALERLCDYLNGECVTTRLQHELGATALGGGRITITKEFLRRIPLPR